MRAPFSGTQRSSTALFASTTKSAGWWPWSASTDSTAFTRWSIGATDRCIEPVSDMASSPREVVWSIGTRRRLGLSSARHRSAPRATSRHQETAMKAAVLHAPHQAMTIEDVAIDKPRRREVLVRTAAAGLCHSDLHFIEGAYPTPVPVVL